MIKAAKKATRYIILICAVTIISSCDFSTDEKADEAILRGQGVVYFYEKLRSFAGIAVADYHLLNSRAVENEPGSLNKIVVNAFNHEEMQADIRLALADVLAPVVDVGAFSEASHDFIHAYAFYDANSFTAEMIVLKQELSEYPEEDGRAQAEEYKRKIASSPYLNLVDDMGIYEIGIEQLSAVRLIVKAMKIYDRADSARLREMSDAELDKFIDQLIKDAWAMPVNQRTPEFRPGPAELFLKASSALALSSLPPEQVSVLQEFYSSPEGRRKRQALVDTFKAKLKADSRKMLLVYFNEFRR